MAYAEVDDLIALLQGSNTTYTQDDPIYADVLDEATAAIDNYCHRSFAVPSDDSNRFYSSSRDGYSIIGLDDIANTTDLAVAVDTSDSGTYTALDSSDWYTVVDNVSGAIKDIRFASPIYPSHSGRLNVRVTARFGWPAVPTPIRRACLILATRLFSRKDSPAGVIGFEATGATVRLGRVDPDVQALLNPYVDYSGLVA